MTAAAAPNEHEREEELKRVGANFFEMIKFRTRRGARHVGRWSRNFWRWVTRTAVTTKDVTVAGAILAWMGMKGAGKWIWWAAGGALAFVGSVLFHTFRILGEGFIWAIMWLVWGLGALFTMVGLVLSYIVYFIIKVAHFIALVLCTPWIGLHSRQALREDWEIFFTGLKPANMHIIQPSSLAAQSVHERDVKASRARAENDGRAPSSTSRRTTRPKGRPTAKRAARSVKRPGPSAATA